MYGGSSKLNATKSLIKHNEPAKLGETYSMFSDYGVFMIVIPNEDKQTEFEFEHWTGPYDEGIFERLHNF